MTSFRVGIDTGGTFTDAVLTGLDRKMFLGKATTTPDRVSRGVLEAISVASIAAGIDVEAVLAGTELLVYGTTHATNAIVEGKTARTAFLTTRGHGDMLVLREGGKSNAFDFRTPYPEPYVPKSLTFEVTERMDAEGGVVQPLDEDELSKTLARLSEQGVEAVGVCFLWSIANPAHELRVGELVRDHLPGVDVTLSHEVSPTIREYRRASTTVIDASIKRLMQRHLADLVTDLHDAGFGGELYVATSMGGVMHVDDIIRRPILTVRSGPSLAPVAGSAFAKEELASANAIVCDAGGTTFEVSLVRDGKITTNRETWLGTRDTGHIVAVSSVDTRSIGAGGGSIARIDAGGMLHVGPESAGAVPGPACYGRGGKRPTVTDAAVVLGYIDPNYFLGGRMCLDADAAHAAVGALADELGQPVEIAATGILTVAQLGMVAAIQEITIRDGIDPRESVLVSGGGSAGLSIIPIAEALACRTILVPSTAGVLSASGAQFSDIVAEFSVSQFASSDRFDLDGVNAALASLGLQAEDFASSLRARGFSEFSTAYFAEARYAHQIWEQETPLAIPRIETAEDVAGLVEAFHGVHERIFSFRDETQTVEFPYWKARFSAALPKPSILTASTPASAAMAARHRRVFLSPGGWADVPLYEMIGSQSGAHLLGPALLVEPFNTIVVHAGWSARVTAGGSYVLEKI